MNIKSEIALAKHASMPTLTRFLAHSEHVPFKHHASPARLRACALEPSYITLFQHEICDVHTAHLFAVQSARITERRLLDLMLIYPERPGHANEAHVFDMGSESINEISCRMNNAVSGMSSVRQTSQEQVQLLRLHK